MSDAVISQVTDTSVGDKQVSIKQINHKWLIMWIMLW